MKLGDLAIYLGGQLIGDPNIEITGVATIEEARPNQITFLTNRKYLPFLAKTQASAIILDKPALLPERISGIISPNPYLAFAKSLKLFFSPPPLLHGIDSSAMISPSASLGKEVSIGPFSVVSDGVTIGDQVTILSHCAIYPGVKIGAQTLIHSHCVVREGCQLGHRVILQNGAIIGSDGFGYAREDDHSWYKIPQTGTVIIEDEVEIGSGATIDRATLGATVIKRGVKIDNQVHIGHGSTVGEDTLLCAQVGLAGTTHVGKQVILSGQVGTAGHLTIGDQVIATAQAGIPGSILPGRHVSGSPAIDHRDWLKAVAVVAQLPKLQKEILSLKKRLEELES